VTRYVADAALQNYVAALSYGTSLGYPEVFSEFSRQAGQVAMLQAALGYVAYLDVEVGNRK